MLDKLSNNEDWTSIQVDAPANATHVRLILGAFQNGGGQYGGFDDIAVKGIAEGD